MKRSLLAVVLGSGLLCGAAADDGPASEIRVLSYNTHGLATWAAGDDPQARFPRIGELTNGYDVALLQEDFAHHRQLREGARHGSIERGNPGRFAGWLCPICEGAGLTLLVRWREAVRALSNVAYGTCAGWLGQANDCFANKGFQHARLRLPGGWQLDVVNTHLDAGDAPTDQGARRRQLALLRRHLERQAEGRPLIVAGDFNLDALEPSQAALRDEFVAALGLVDSGAARAPDSSWDRIDFIYLRDGRATHLEVLEAGEDRRFVHEGLPLSDHPAIFARIRVEAR